MKKSIRIFLMVPTVALLIAAVCYLSFKAIEQSIIEDNEVLVHSMAQSLLPPLLAGDTRQVDQLIKSLGNHSGIQTAELVSGSGISLASYVRGGSENDLGQTEFALASSDQALSSQQLHVMAPLTFDTQILANLHVAVDLWPAYLRVIHWLGLSLIVLSAIFIIIKKRRVRIRLQNVFEETGFGSEDSFSVDQALREALQEADIFVAYKPVKRLSDNGVFGVEAVICWNHPSGQTVYLYPADFISLTESIGLILPLGTWILESACIQMADWQSQHGPLVLSFNISPSQLKDPCFCQTVRQICEASQYPYQLIEFQINEAMLLRQDTALMDVEKFTQQGMSLTIEGFGLSPRSLELLESFSIHKIKFAPQLMRNMANDKDVLSHLQSLGRLAGEHEVQIMADGIQNEDQAILMQKLGCVLGQGSLVSPVLSPTQFEALLSNQVIDDFSTQKNGLGLYRSHLV